MKAIKNYLWMVAVTMMAVFLGACSSDDMTVNEAPIRKSQVLTLVTTLSPITENANMRSTMTDNGTSISTAWEVDDKIWVNYEDTGGNNLVAKGTVSAVDGEGKATITVDLVDPKDGSDIMFGFPYDHWTEAKDVRVDQVGTLDDINQNHAAISGSGTLTVAGSVVTLPDDVSMYQDMCIWKLNLKDGSTDITDQITSLNISFGPYDDYMITPNSQSDIYVALYPVVGGDITITAATATGLYSYSKSGITLDNGRFYRSSVSLSAAAASSTYRVFTSRTVYTDETIPAGATTMTSETTDWTTGTYVVSSSLTIANNVTVTGDVNLILKDGTSLTVNGYIMGGNLNIYGQTLETGILNVGTSDPGIAVTNLTIHGGDISVDATYQGVETGDDFKIYHGKVNTTGAMNGINVMGDMYIYGGDITTTATNGIALQIYGASGNNGSLTMTGGILRARGIGTGSNNKGILVEEGTGKGTATVNISGGTLIATGGVSDNTDSGADAIDIQGTLTISGAANVTADGGTDAYDMGGGYGINVREGTDAGGSATISGGTVTVTSGPSGMAAISIQDDLTISGTTTVVEATGGDMGEGILAFGTITISSGLVTANAGEQGIALEGTVIVNGGNVTAIGGDAIGGSGGDGMAGVSGALTVNGGIVAATGGAGDGSGSDGLGVDGATVITLGSGMTFYEGDSPNPTSTGTPPTCTKRFVIIK